MEKKTILEGNFNAEGLKFGIVCARFNNFFVENFVIFVFCLERKFV